MFANLNIGVDMVVDVAAGMLNVVAVVSDGSSAAGSLRMCSWNRVRRARRSDGMKSRGMRHLGWNPKGAPGDEHHLSSWCEIPPTGRLTAAARRNEGKITDEEMRLILFNATKEIWSWCFVSFALSLVSFITHVLLNRH